MTQPLPVVAEPIIEPPTPPAKKFSPILILVSVFLLVIVGAGGLILGKSLNNSQPSVRPTATPLPTQIPAPDETANWKTYTSEKHKFTLKYPANLNLIGNCQTGYRCGFYQKISDEDRRGVPDTRFDILIMPDNPKDRPKEETYDPELNESLFKLSVGESITLGPGSSGIYKRLPDILVNGFQSKAYVNNSVWEAKEGTIQKVVYIQKGNNLFMINAFTESGDITLKVFDQILSTFKFTDQNSPNLSLTSPDASYAVTETMAGDYNTIVVKDSSGKIITNDLIKKNEKAIGYGTKFSCQCGTSFAGWTDNSHFILKIVNGDGEEYQYTVDASTALVSEVSFKKVR